MPERDIFVTENDARTLRTLLVSVRERSAKDREHLQQLGDELDRARVVTASEIPANVVTMNSELALRDLDTGEQMVFRVVFPSEANPDQHRISVLAPLGTAVLGYRAGDAIESSFRDARSGFASRASFINRKPQAPPLGFKRG